MKKLVIAAVILCRLSIAHAQIINGLAITGTTERVVDVAHTTNINISSVGNVDWVLMGTNSLTAVSESKSGGEAFTNFASSFPPSQIMAATNNQIMFSWSDGDPTLSSTGTLTGVRVDSLDSAYQEIMSFELNLAPSTNEYRLNAYMTDQRTKTQLHIWDNDAGDWLLLTQETDNDALDLRVHNVLISGVESNEVLKFKLDAARAKATHALRAVGAFALELVEPTVAPEESSLVLDPAGQLDVTIMAPAMLATGMVNAAFTYGTGSNNVDITGVAFSNLSHGAGSFSSLDSFPINLTEPSPSNEALTVQFDNSIANLSLFGETASGTMQVSWTSIGSGITNTTELSVVATFYSPTAVNWSGTEIVAANINSPTRDDVVNGTNSTLRWQAYSFDPVGAPLFTNLNPVALEFAGGVAVYSTNADTVVSMDRRRVANASPDDSIWFRSQNQGVVVSNTVDYYDGVSIASAYLWQSTESISLGDITRVDAKFNNIGAPGEARLLLSTGGQQYISEAIGWTNIALYTLNSVTGLTWASYVPGELVTDGGVTYANADMRFDTAIIGGFSALPASTAVSAIGVAAHVHGAAASTDDASFNLGRFVVSIPAGFGGGYEVWAGLFGLSGSPDADADYDYDLDGLDNLTEYGLGGDPTTNDAASIVPVSAVVNDAGIDWFYHIHNERTDDPSLTFTVQANTDLTTETWETNGVDFVGETGESGGFKTVTNRTDVGSQEFVRLQIEQN